MKETELSCIEVHKYRSQKTIYAYIKKPTERMYTPLIDLVLADHSKILTAVRPRQKDLRLSVKRVICKCGTRHFFFLLYFC